VAALALALVFTTAAVSKLVRRPDMTGLGLPAATPVAVAVVELGLAVALVSWPANAGIAALALLAGFTAYLAANLGADTGCGCFGSTRGSAIRRRDLVRNAGLMALAAVAAFV
jgi:hypothetical protein